MAAALDRVRLLGPPLADGEYVMLAEHEIVHLHDYARIYREPGLYEHVVQERLHCRSPQVAVEGFMRGVAHLGLEPAPMAVLDVGAGTGLVGELLRREGIAQVIGVDALAEARAACLRDRPGVYADYLVGDLGSRASPLRPALHRYELVGLVCAGAFGGTHAQPQALTTALAALAVGAPVAFTIGEQWMDSSDPEGFGGTIERLEATGALEVVERTRFQHRLTTTGQPVFYELICGLRARDPT